MKTKLTKFITPVALAATALLALGILPALAATTTFAAAAAAKTTAATNTRIMSRADKEITRRVDALDTLTARLNEMQKLSSDEITSLSSSLHAQISTLTALQAKVTADASDTTALRADAQSITSSYRIFALVLPQGAIEAAADRVLTIVDSMNTLGTKLQARIASSTAAGNNTSSSVAAYADFTAKVSDAQTQANAAVAEVSPLTPDMGNQAQFQANLTALKDARSKIQAAQKDLVAARKDAGTIVKSLIQFDASANASTSASGTAQ